MAKHDHDGQSTTAGTAVSTSARSDAAPLTTGALLSNTSICEASRALLGEIPTRAGWGDVRTGGMRVADLMALIDAVVLHDRLYSLPAALPADLDTLGFRNALLAHDVLSTLTVDTTPAARALLYAFGTVSDHPGVRASGDMAPADMAPAATAAGDTAATDMVEPASFDDFRDDIARLVGLPAASPAAASSTTDEFVDVSMAADANGNGARSFDDAARDIVEGMDYGVSGAYEGSVLGVRAMYYVFVAEAKRLHYVPSVSVRGIARNFPNYFASTARTLIYEQLAGALRTTVDAVAKEFNRPAVFIPPFSALVFARASDRQRIPEETLALREEYAGFRSRMADLEKERLAAQSLKARMKAVRQMEMLCEEVAKPLGGAGIRATTKLESSLRYVPDVADLAVNPTNPVQWTKLLLDKPVELLLAWHRRRPIVKLIRAADELLELDAYDELVAKHFGEDVAVSVRSYERR